MIDPVRTETAELADIHLRVAPGSDAWCLAALLGVIVQEGLVDGPFLEAHTDESGPVLDALNSIPISAFAARCGVDQLLMPGNRQTDRQRRQRLQSEDLGIQQGPNSVLCSYLNKLLWLLTGNFGRPGAMHLHSWLASLSESTVASRGRR